MIVSRSGRVIDLGSMFYCVLRNDAPISWSSQLVRKYVIGIGIAVKRLVKPPANGRNPEGIPARRMTESGREEPDGPLRSRHSAQFNSVNLSGGRHCLLSTYSVEKLPFRDEAIFQCY